MKSLFFSLMVLALLIACKPSHEDGTLFTLLSPDKTGVDFMNKLVEDDSLNIIAYDYMYNGAGVAVGDFNNDGLSDIFFAGNKVSSKLFLNLGDFKFKDVTKEAGLTTNQWCEGVTLVDLNNDGFLDIYVSTSSGYSYKSSPNLLFINNGIAENGLPAFTEKASEYGIDDDGYNTQAAFFDYNKDGHLDLYVLSNALENFSRNTSRPKKVSGQGTSTDKLYRNNGDGTFTNVSSEAGILIEGYGLGIAISDLNKDGWPDIYIANDFVTNDLLYMNNGNGTFTNAIATMMKHQSHNGMGADIADFNNDGFADIAVLDMMPDDNLRQKTMFPSVKHDQYKLNINFGYEPQFVRNTLQLNNGNGSFSEIGQLAGIYKTDWSWAPLFADFDNDGLRDLYITNGYGKDITDLDYSVYSSSMIQFGTLDSKKKKAREGISKLVEVKKHNYIFKNNGDLTFSDKTADWGFLQPSLSNGVAYADFDNDGDLDLVINNVNDPAFLYRNNTIKKNNIGKEGVAFLDINLEGSVGNRQGIGSKITIYYSKGTASEKQFYEHYLTRGYKSSVAPKIHFGLGEAKSIDSIAIEWPDGKYQLMKNVKVNQALTLKYTNATTHKKKHVSSPPTLFYEASDRKGLNIKSESESFADFKVQSLLPHKHSANGPGIAVADYDGDGLEDFYIGGSVNHPGKLYKQNQDGTFNANVLDTEPIYDDMGALFFDADMDKDLDLYVVSGGSRYPAGSEAYEDRLYSNDGEGNYIRNTDALPEMSISGSIVTAADFDKDGDLDLFVGGRLIPGKYPLPAKSYILRNDAGKFVDITKEVCPQMEKLGLVTAALWSDFDSDGLIDLVIAGEWMPVTLLKQEKNGHESSQFINVTEKAGLSKTSGWWNSLVAEDFDNDGDMDYVAGNLGLNSRYKASETEPVSIYAKDFDSNGSIDPLMFYYIQGENYPAIWRDDLIGQLPHLRHRFERYADYGKTTFESFFKEGELDGAYVLKNYLFESSFIENLGNSNFSVRPLPLEAQFSPVYGIISKDFNTDGNIDLLLVGNSYATEIQVGRYDASIGNYLEGDGKGGFKAIPVNESGFFVDGDAKAMVHLTEKDGSTLILISQHADSLKVYKPQQKQKKQIVTLSPLDQRAEIRYKNGKVFKKEFYHGSSYLSQSSRVLPLNDQVESIDIYDYAGNKRALMFPEKDKIVSRE